MKLKKLVTLTLALVLSLSVSAGALAAEEEISVIEVDPDSIVLVGDVIGSLSDQDGILLDDAATITRTTGALFSMTATQVSKLLTTYGVAGKSFTGGVIDGLKDEGILISGKVTTTLGTGSSIKVKVGACFYNASNDTFISVSDIYFPSGTTDSWWLPKLGYFSNSVTYYGHITNNHSSGTISGTLSFSVAVRPAGY